MVNFRSLQIEYDNRLPPECEDEETEEEPDDSWCEAALEAREETKWSDI
jgi:hypothetical protein